MTCSLNSPLSEDTLSAVIDGLVDDETSAHLAQCPGCRARLEAARAIEHSLHTRLYRLDCPSSQELADYHLGFVAVTDPIRDRAIIRHLETCSSCAAEIETLRAFLADAPAAVSAPQPAPQPQRSSIGEVFARLLPRAPQMALRGAVSATISAEIDDLTLIFEPQAGPHGLTLHGQVLALDTE
ncbi:MAG TPA: hypothetical protein VFT99_16970, partial [Roseiflexaceae bacterium]|nr:hypothetical protein [Roseiflexaceae bacterium]